MTTRELLNVVAAELKAPVRSAAFERHVAELRRWIDGKRSARRKPSEFWVVLSCLSEIDRKGLVAKQPSKSTHHQTLDDVSTYGNDGTPKLISGGAFEMNRRRH